MTRPRSLFKNLSEYPPNISYYSLEVGSRCFPEWSMKYVRSPSVAAKIYREAGFKEFNPYLLDKLALNAMALAFRNHHEPNEVKHAATEHYTAIPKKASSFDILKFFGRGA